MIAVLVVCLLGCAVALAWPRAGVLARLSGARPAFRLGTLPRLRMPVSELGRRGVFGAAGLAALAGLLLGGPVAALIGAIYAALGMAEWLRRAGRKRVAAGRATALDGLSALVADLRAGLPPALVAAGPLDGDGRLTHLTGAVWRLAERTGAPAADLLERIESDARAVDRAAASASAQAAGAHATAVLLAALPLGGIALGYSIGADPLQILLRTPLGAACAIAAVLLQCGGLRWARRLVEGPR
ncbi:type II secretion system F family protein [Actinoplanes sp. HUAS TT8]|uniref:type II secretion system F family protein n=1 Tax=Actinoplanes sp. HUAS TT8 TaxID=3447453 RepID=UPI003F525E4B